MRKAISNGKKGVPIHNPHFVQKFPLFADISTESPPKIATCKEIQTKIFRKDEKVYARNKNFYCDGDNKVFINGAQNRIGYLISCHGVNLSDFLYIINSAPKALGRQLRRLTYTL